MSRCALLFALLASFFLAGSPATAATETATDNPWRLAAKARSPADISLWTRTVPGAQLKAFRGATHVEVPMESVTAFLHDTEAMTHWVFRCKEARILAENDDGTMYVHLKIDGIWPLEDRDAVVKVIPDLVPATGELRLIGVAAPDYLPPQPDHIRIPSIESTWLMRPGANGLLYVEWSGHVDPAGNVPRWLANTLVTLVPRYTLKHMRELVADPKWRQPAQREFGHLLIERVRNNAR